MQCNCDVVDHLNRCNVHGYYDYEYLDCDTCLFAFHAESSYNSSVATLANQHGRPVQLGIMADLVGDGSGDELGSASAGASKRRGARPQRRKPGPSSSAGGTENDDVRCFLCSCPGVVCKTWRGHRFDSQCFAAVRCYNRIQRGNVAAQDASLKKLRETPALWREDVMPLIASTPGSRPSSARAQASQTIHKAGSFRKRARIADTLELTKPRFKRFRKLWDEVGSDEASEEFEDKWLEEGQKRNKKKEPVIHEEDIIRTRVEEGELSEDYEQQKDGASRPRTFTSASSRTAMSKAGGRGNASDESEEDGEDEDDGRSTAGASSAGRSAASRLTAMKLEKHTKQNPAGEEQADPPLPPRSRASPSGKMTPVQLLRDKELVKAQVNQASESATGSSSTLKKLEAELKALTDEQKTKLDKDTSALIPKLHGQVTSLHELRDKIDGLRASEFDEAFFQIDKAVAEIEKTKQTVEEHYAAAAFLNKMDRTNSRAAKAAVRYQKSKIVNSLVANGWGTAHAKRVAQAGPDEMKVTWNPDGTLNMQEVSCWAPTSSASDDTAPAPEAPSLDLAAKAAKFTEAMQESIDIKSASMQKALKDKAAWGGALLSLDTGSRFDWELPEAPELMDKNGAAPSLVGCRVHANRILGAAWPLQGLASLVLALDEPMTLQLFSCEHLVGQGIAMADLKTFLETPSGHTFFKDHGHLVQVPARGVAYIPNGFVVAPVAGKLWYASKAEGEQDQAPCDKQVQKAGQVHLCLHVPILNAKLAAAELSETSVAAVGSYNREHFKKFGAAKYWQDKAELFEKFFETLVAEAKKEDD